MPDPALHPAYEAAAAFAVGRFPVSVDRLETISAAENLTFRVTDPDGEQYALRLHRPGYNSLEELESERAWVAALAAANIAVQTAVPTRDGDHFIPQEIPELGETRFVGMTHWLSGELLIGPLEEQYDSERRAAAFRDMGALAARMHNQAEAWSPPADFTRPIIDRDGLVGEAPRWGRFWEHRELDSQSSRYLGSLREPLAQLLDRYGANPSNFSLIHADLHAGNLLLTGNGLGVIDFDDAAFGWHMYDLATALVEYRDDADFSTLRDGMLAGYRQERRLSEEDLAMLPVFLLLRELALIGWLHERPEYSGEPHVETVLQWALQDARSLIG